MRRNNTEEPLRSKKDGHRRDGIRRIGMNLSWDARMTKIVRELFCAVSGGRTEDSEFSIFRDETANFKTGEGVRDGVC